MVHGRGKLPTGAEPEEICDFRPDEVGGAVEAVSHYAPPSTKVLSLLQRLH